MTHAVRHVCTRHRGDTQRAFTKRFLRRIPGNFPEGGTLQKRNSSRQGCAKEPKVVWQCWRKVTLVVNGEGDENERSWGLGNYFHARPQYDVKLALADLYTLLGKPGKQHENQSLKLDKYYAYWYVYHAANNIRWQLLVGTPRPFFFLVTQCHLVIHI